jgi:Rod binding domain-containing protein
MNGTQIGKIITVAAAAGPVAAKLKKTSQEIEAIFVKDLMAAMRKTAEHKSLGNSLGSDMYEDIFDQALADSTAKSGSLGIGNTIFKQMAPLAVRSAIERALREARPVASTNPVINSEKTDKP